jgi:hypothetical protein
VQPLWWRQRAGWMLLEAACRPLLPPVGRVRLLLLLLLWC